MGIAESVVILDLNKAKKLKSTPTTPRMPLDLEESKILFPLQLGFLKALGSYGIYDARRTPIVSVDEYFLRSAAVLIEVMNQMAKVATAANEAFCETELAPGTAEVPAHFRDLQKATLDLLAHCACRLYPSDSDDEEMGTQPAIN
jgi:hypothetical protein